MCRSASCSYSWSSSLIREQPVTRDKNARSPVDWMGFGFVALSLGCLQIVLDRGQEDDWLGSGFITALILISAAGFRAAHLVGAAPS